MVMGKPSEYMEELDVERGIIFKRVLETKDGKF